MKTIMIINRSYNKEKKLIIGCGNDCRWCKHKDDYTIDIDKTMDPSIVMDVRDLQWKGLSNIPDQSFQYIEMEGLTLHFNKINLITIQNIIKEFERIRSPKSVVYADFLLPGSYRNQKGCWDNNNFRNPFISYDRIKKLSVDHVRHILSFDTKSLKTKPLNK